MYIFLSRAFFADNQYLKFLLQLIQYPRYLLRPKIKIKKEKKRRKKTLSKNSLVTTSSQLTRSNIIERFSIVHSKTSKRCPQLDRQLGPITPADNKPGLQTDT